MDSEGVMQYFVRLHAEALRPKLVSALLAEADGLASCPNYWLPRELVSGPKELRATAEEAVRELYSLFMKPRLSDSFAGAEWWVQVYEPGSGLAFHFDKDEHLYAAKQQMRHPILSSVLYLTGSQSLEGPRQGPTVIIDQTFDNRSRSAVPGHPEKCTFVWPRSGTFAVFPGQLGHGVLDSASEERRVTMLINWWAYQPQAIQPPPVASCQPNSGLENLGLLESTDETQPKDGLHKPQTIPTIRLQQEEDLQVVSVDDLMESYNISCIGASAVDILALEHPGYYLYPIECSEEQIRDLCTAAALVSRATLSTESESNDGSD